MGGIKKLGASSIHLMAVSITCMPLATPVFHAHSPGFFCMLLALWMALCASFFIPF